MTGQKTGNPESLIDVTTPPESDKPGSDDSAPNAWEMLGIEQPPFLDERFAPRVDRDFLRRFVRRELPENAQSAACQLILLFRGWSEAHKEIVADETGRPKKA